MTKLKDFMMQIIEKNSPKSNVIKSIINENATEQILGQLPMKEAFPHDIKGLSFNVLARQFLEGATLEHVGVYDKSLALIFSKDDYFFGLDWCDGFGATIARYLPPVNEDEYDNKN